MKIWAMIFGVLFFPLLINGQNTETDFVSFSILESDSVATINTVEHRIEMEIEPGSDLSHLTPDFSLSQGATAETVSGVVQDFRSELSITVTAEDGSTTQDWVIEITTAATPYTFVGSSPANGGYIVPGESIFLTLSETINTDFLNAENFSISSTLRGDITFSSAGGANPQLQLIPSTDLEIGDDIIVTIRNKLVPGGEQIRFKVVKDEPEQYDFKEATIIEMSTFSPTSFEIVDVDGDGDLDFLSNSLTRSGDVVFSENNGAQSPGFDETIIAVDLDYSGDLNYLDFNRDGDNDVVVGRRSGGGGAALYVFNDTEGIDEFLFPGDGDPVGKLLTGDLNNDLLTDIITFNEEDQKLVMFQSQDASTPNFTLETKVSNDGVSDFLLADLNSDGYLDILAQTNLGIRGYYNDGNANPTFIPFSLITNFGNNPFQVGHLEEGDNVHLVTDGESGITIYTLSYDESNSEPGVSNYYTYSGGQASSALNLVDMDSDGDMDIVSLENQLVWYENQSDTEPKFVRNIIAEGESGDVTLHVADMNRDSDLDIVIAYGMGVKLYEAVPAEKAGTDILSFSLSGQVFPSTIDTINHTIDIRMPHRGLSSNPTATFELSEGASIGFTNGDFIPFQPQIGRTLTVTAADGVTTQDWVVTVWPEVIESLSVTAYYPFDGNGLDISGYGHSGTTSGELGERLDRFGVPYSLAQGATFNFHSAFNIFSQSSYTVSFWIKVSDSPDGEVLTSPHLNLAYESVAGEIHSKFSTEDGILNGPTIPISNGVWEHCVFSVSGESITAYRNGTQVSSSSSTGGFLFDQGDLIIGDSDATFEIDDMVVIAFRIDAETVTEIYTEQADAYYPNIRPLFYGIDHPDQSRLERLDWSNRTVEVTMPSGTDFTDLSFQVRLVGEPKIEIEGVETGSFISGDFSEDVTLTFTSEDGLTTQDWVVSVIENPLRNETDFLTFTVPGQTFPAFIDDGDHRINLPVSETVDITDLVPTFTLSPGATADFSSGVARNFSNPVTYTVTSGSGLRTQDWVVTIEQRTASESNDFITFEFAEQTGPAEIDLINHVVTAEVGFGSDLTSLVPTFTLAAGASSDPASGVAQDFTNAVTYTITAANLSEQIWQVVVTALDEVSTATDITSFRLPDQVGEEVIDKVNHTVDIIMPIGTDRSNLTPTIELSFGATVTPESGEARDFNFENTYTVLAQDGITMQEWAVNADVEANAPPSNILLNNTRLLAVTQTGQLVGKIQVIDPNVGDTHTLSIVSGGSDFTIVENNLVTASALNARNYDVTIAAQDLAGAQISRNFTIEVIALETDEAIAIGSTIDDYRIIGMPTDQVQVADVFTNLEASEQGTSWRILDYQTDETYVDLTTSSRLQAGKGYWILSEKEVTVLFQEDPVTLDEEGNFNLTLVPGWNLISNPFIDELDWNQNIQRNISEGNFGTSDIQDGLVVYNGAYSSSSSLGIFQGAWVNVLSSRNLNVALQSPSASEVSSGRSEVIDIRELRLSLTDGRKTSTLSGFSFHDQASLQLDRFDQSYPPEVSPDRPFRLDGKNGIDFNAIPFAESFSWEWEVLAPSSSELYLTWNVDQVAKFDRELHLVLNGERAFSMRHSDRISINHGDRVEVLYGPNDSRLVIQIYPNPVREELNVNITSFSDRLPDPVTVAIYDLSGRMLSENRFDQSEEIQISTEHLKDGLYIVRAWVDDVLVDESKVMVQHK